MYTPPANCNINNIVNLFFPPASQTRRGTVRVNNTYIYYNMTLNEVWRLRSRYRITIMYTRIQQSINYTKRVLFLSALYICTFVLHYILNINIEKRVYAYIINIVYTVGSHIDWDDWTIAAVIIIYSVYFTL